MKATDLREPIDPASPPEDYVGSGDWWWRVSSPYVTVKTSTTEGMRIIGQHRGAPLPMDVQPESLKHLADHNLIERFPVTRAERQHLVEEPPGKLPPPDAAAAAGQVPTPGAGAASTSVPSGAGSSGTPAKPDGSSGPQRPSSGQARSPASKAGK